MKTEFIDVSDTQKNLVVEIDSNVVDAEIDKVSRDYSKAARIPGFRPGKVPTKVVRQRFRDQILHDVAHGLIPRAVDEALRERGVEPVDTPDIKDVVVEEGQPLKFTASFETVPPIEPGDYSTLTVKRGHAQVEDAAVDQALSQLRERAARYEPVEDRGVERGDSVLMDLVRTTAKKTEEPLIVIPGQEPPRETETDKHDNVTVDIGAPGQSSRLRRGAHRADRPGTRRRSTSSIPRTTPSRSSPGRRCATTWPSRRSASASCRTWTTSSPRTSASSIRSTTLTARVRADLEHEAGHEAEREMRADLLKQLSSRVQFDVPASLLDREIDRRVEEFVRRLMEQQIDPMQTNINWEEFRERQKEGAAESVRSALVLDEIARREGISVPEAEVEAEVARYAERTRPDAGGRPRPAGEGRGASAGSTRRSAGRRPSPSCSPARLRTE